MMEPPHSKEWEQWIRADEQERNEFTLHVVREYVAFAEALAAKLVEVICQQERGKDAWRKIARGYRAELAAAEAVAAKLVEVICDRESDYRNAIWELGVIYNALEAARAEASDWKRYAKVVEEQRDAARVERQEALQKVAALDDHLATLKRLDDADTAEINRLKEAVALRAEVATLSAEIDRMVGELSSIRMEHEAEVAVLQEQVEAMGQHWTCQRCGQKPIWTECGNARCKIKVHPYCACNRDDEVDGHWCDDGCPSKVLADLRAKVEGMRDEAKADPVGSAVWRTTAYESVLALIEEAGQ